MDEVADHAAAVERTDRGPISLSNPGSPRGIWRLAPGSRVARVLAGVGKSSHLRITNAGLRAALARLALPAWFVFLTVLMPISTFQEFGSEASLYRRAAETWLVGGNPWREATFGVPFAGPPTALLIYAPFALVPEPLGTILLMVLGLAATTFVLRRLELGWWWVLFPPVTQALWNGAATMIVLALLLMTHPLATALGGMVKTYGLIPAILQARWREVAAFLALMAVVSIILPWQLWITMDFGLAALREYTWQGSAWSFPLLVVPTVAALWLLRHNEGPWFAVPALYPATQPAYSVFALPALVGHPWVAALLAVQVRGIPPLTVILFAGWTLWSSCRRRAR